MNLGKGWKLFYRVNWKSFDRTDWTARERPEDILASAGFKRGPTLPIGKWLHEKKFRKHPQKTMIYTDRGEYKTGWHIYKTMEDALRLHWYLGEIVRKVEYRNIVATITEDGRRVVVAKEIKILNGLGSLKKLSPKSKGREK